MIDTKCYVCDIVLEHEPRRKPVHCPQCKIVLRHTSGLTDAMLTEVAAKLIGTCDFPSSMVNRLGYGDHVFYAHLVDDLAEFGLKTVFNGTVHIWKYMPAEEERERSEMLKNIVDNMNLECIV